MRRPLAFSERNLRGGRCFIVSTKKVYTTKDFRQKKILKKISDLDYNVSVEILPIKNFVHRQESASLSIYKKCSRVFFRVSGEGRELTV